MRRSRLHQPGMQRAARLIGSLGGLGYCPVAPGTLASAAAALTGLALLRLDAAALPIAVLAATVVGVFAIKGSGAAQDDPNWIVIDELAGQWVALLALPERPSLTPVLSAFVLFRLFDIVKLGPVGWIDRRHSAVAVMADDLVAGALAAAVLLAAAWIQRHLVL